MIVVLVFASVAAIIINAIAFAANAGVLWVVLRNRTLKKAPTSVFLVNLCAADLAVAVIVIPVATVVLILWSFDDDGAVIPTSLCGSLSFFHSLLVNAGAWAAAAISVDRRFSIVSPMAHAAFMTSRRALLGVALVWTTAILFAVVPHLYPSQSSSLLFNYTTSVETYVSFVSSSSSSLPSSASGNSSSAARRPPVFNSSSAIYLTFNSSTSVFTSTSSAECRLWNTCALMFSLDWSDSGQVFAALIGCYLIPTCIMVSMYLSIFKVARKCGRQVYPVRPCNSAISTVSEEVEIKEEYESNVSRGEDTITKENDPKEGENGSRLFRADLTENTLDRIGIQIGDRKPSEGTEKDEPESSRHCIFQHLFPKDKGAAVMDRPFRVEEDSTERLERPPVASRPASKSCRCSGKCARCCRGSASRVTSCSSTVAGYKARRTLLLILGLSLGSWSPYYLLHAYCASTDDCWRPITSCPPWGHKTADRVFWKAEAAGHKHHMTCDVPCTSDSFPVSFLVYQRSLAALVVAWLLFLSSAFNPILYGLLNRPVREQILLRAGSMSAALSHARRYVCRVCGAREGPAGGGGNPVRSAEEAEGGEEDFLQFLERTSSISECVGPRLPIAGSSASLSSRHPSAAEAGRYEGKGGK